MLHFNVSSKQTISHLYHEYTIKEKKVILKLKDKVNIIERFQEKKSENTHNLDNYHRKMHN